MRGDGGTSGRRRWRHSDLKWLVRNRGPKRAASQSGRVRLGTSGYPLFVPSGWFDVSTNGSISCTE